MNTQLNEINRHLKTFLYFSKQQAFDVVCKSAIYLIQNLPSSRHSVLEYFTTIYELATVFHVNRNNSNQEDVNNLNEVIDEIQQVFLNLIKNEAWSNELSEWSVDVIAFLSKKYEQSIIKSQQQPQQPLQSVSIIDSLHIWTQCKPIKNLLDLTQMCITESKNNSEVIEKLLSVYNAKYGSSCDWIVCHLGSLCPQETILNLLIIGFKEFLTQTSLQIPKLSMNILKFNSIILILNYFTNLNSRHVRDLLMQILQNYLKGDYDYFKKYFLINSDQVKQFTILYLIQLALLSPNLSYIMSVNIKETLNRNVLENIYFQSKQTFSFESRNNLFINLKQLLKQQTNNSYDFLNYLIDLSTDAAYEDDFKKIIKNFIQSFFDDLNAFILTNARESIPLIESLKKDYKLILNELLSKEDNSELKKKWLLNMIILIGIQGPSYETNSIMSKMLVAKHYDINNLIKYRQEVEIFDANFTTYSIESIVKVFNSNKHFYMNEQIYVNDQSGIDLTLNEKCLDSFINNLLELHDWDLKNEHSGYDVEKILRKSDTFVDMISLLDDNYSTIIKLYNKIGIAEKINIDHYLKISHYLTKYFFKIIEADDDKIKQIIELENIKQLIQVLCLKNNDLFRNIMIRNLIDYLFDQTKFYHFQTKKAILCDNNNNPNTDFDAFNDIESDKYVSLYEQNMALSKHLPLTKLRTKIPLVDNFSRNRSKLSDRQDKLSLLNYEFMELLDIMCLAAPISTQTKSNKIINTNLNYNIDLLNNLAQLVVEKFNATYIDYQWPDIENLKLFIERDVKVQNIVDESPICWMLLNLIANNQLSFCKCLPVIRSLLASIILQWENVKEQPTKTCPKLFELTIKFLNLINKAQLLPVPLLYIVDIIQLVNSYEAHVLLTIIWKYLKTLLQNQTNSSKTITIQHKTPEKSSIDQMKIIFQRNLNTLAHLYVKFFKDFITTNQPATLSTLTSTEEDSRLVIIS